ncbi:TT1751-like protein [Cristinia sonorae]|uniref:TT1751-like protein n=1 Tax=Cristinia sonorae TaxID=1940300 RepID=A0A8K0XR75_9AGAR|nr:TT1751-like protein [Cristinia sonorae]
MSTITKTLVPYSAQRVVITSPKPIKDVLDALDKEVNKEGAGVNIMRLLATAQSKEEIEKGMKELTEGKRDFVLFAAGSHSRWLSAYFNGARKFPEAHVYTIGNPIIAQTMLQQDLTAGLHVPPKLLVIEAEGGKGTSVVYDLPSSVVLVGSGLLNAELKKSAAVLDEKFEKMVRKVLA